MPNMQGRDKKYFFMLCLALHRLNKNDYTIAYHNTILISNIITTMTTKIDQVDQVKELSKLNPTQTKAMFYSIKKSALFHKTTLPIFTSALLEQGHTINEINNIFNYITNRALLISHFSAVKILSNLASEQHLKNAYESNSKGDNYLTSRTIWENNLFNNLYTNADYFDRPKYASINLTNNPHGVPSLVGYGASYIVYKNSVKCRTTFMFGDTCVMDCHIATFNYCAHILNYYLGQTGMTTLIHDMIQIANNKVQYTQHNVSPYIDAQIHGPINIDEDIESININKNEIKNDDVVMLYASEFSVRHPNVAVNFF